MSLLRESRSKTNMEFERDPNRKRKTKEIKETPLSEPKSTFNLDEFSKQKKTTVQNEIKDESSQSKTVGRPRKNKVYSTIRLQKYNVNRINALQNTLEFETQDDLVASLLDRLENQIEPEQRTMFEMYMKTYESRDRKKKQK